MPGRSRPIPANLPPGRAWPGSTGPTPERAAALAGGGSSRGPSRLVDRAPSARSRSAGGPSADPAFTDDAEAVGLRFVYDNAETPIHQLPEPFGGGLALLDYDGDGWLDVYCVQGGPFPSPEPGSPSAGPGDRLFHNRGDGTFEDVTDAFGHRPISRADTGTAWPWATIDGDGHPDLFVTRWRSYALYRNRGDGTFEDATDAWGLGGRRDWPTSAAFADLDGDGDLDLYVCHYAAWDLDNPRLCRDPKPTGRTSTAARSLPRPCPTTSSAMTAAGSWTSRPRPGSSTATAAASGSSPRDLDDDGRIDLFVANDSSANFLFRNLGGMRFEEIGARRRRGRQRLGGLPGRHGGRRRGPRRRRPASTWPSPISTASRRRSTATWATASSSTRPPRSAWPSPAVACWASASRSSTPTTTAGSTWPRPTATSTTCGRTTLT